MKGVFSKIKGPLILLITAFFWGTTFVAQALGSNYIGPFTYNASRFLVTGIILLIVVIIRHIYKKKKNIDTKLTNENKKKIYITAILIGVFLFLGANLQQAGINITKSPSKSGFISSTYIVFVPLLGLLWKKKVDGRIWLFLVTSMIGSFLISVNGDFSLEFGDIITLFCAVNFAMQIVLIDNISNDIDSIFLATIEFLVAGLLSFILMLFTEPFDKNLYIKAIPAIMFAAIFSGCIAFTLQIVGQKYTDPTIGSMIMGLESVFALLSGIIIMHEVLTLREWIGCIIINISVILAQIDFKKIYRRIKNGKKKKTQKAE